MTNIFNTLVIEPIFYSKKSDCTVGFFFQKSCFIFVKIINQAIGILKWVAVFLAAALPLFLTSTFFPGPYKNNADMGLDLAASDFSGLCESGEKYNLVRFYEILNNKKIIYYDYSGPAGKGKVSTSATPRTMSARVCRAQAEIIDRN